MDSKSVQSEKREEFPAARTVKGSEVDTAAQLTAGKDAQLDPQVASALRRKIDWHLMPFMCILYLMTFADKTTLGQSAILGIM
ncbi:hypothetical protein PQX77_018912 [Marasmius sp. AFHP31]|nr:hypothetical protein PQX77_018912 [Marasmius sp. AFHP31]